MTKLFMILGLVIGASSIVLGMRQIFGTFLKGVTTTSKKKKGKKKQNEFND